MLLQHLDIAEEVSSYQAGAIIPSLQMAVDQDLEACLEGWKNCSLGGAIACKFAVVHLHTSTCFLFHVLLAA